MGLLINIAFLIGSIILLSVSGGFSTDAARRVTTIDNWDANENLKSAHSYLTWSAVITWISLALIIVISILYLIYGVETVELTGNILTYLLIFIVLGLVTTVGILSAIASQKIANAKVSDDKGSRKQAIIAAVLSLGSIGLLITILIIKAVVKHKSGQGKHYVIDKDI